MKSHVWRPLYVVIVLVIVVLVIRYIYVPKDFAVHERGYMYGWYRAGNVEQWKAVPDKFKTSKYCKDCHPEKEALISKTPHASIQCENCHGLAKDHPTDPPKLATDKSREFCLRCHYPLPYPSSDRSKIKGIDPEAHNPGIGCSSCHNPHKPSLRRLK
ncbi:MAG: cytochrome c3 family protein [Smithellaceae bacterium]|nr:cytochrome c3 family protein [Smithellaceae bacterium]